MSSSDLEDDLGDYEGIDIDLEDYDLDEDDLLSFSKSSDPSPIEFPAKACCVLCDKYSNGLKVIRDSPNAYHKKSIKCLLLSLCQKSVECQINSIRNSTITSLYLKVNNLIDIGSSTHFADSFLRMRHEILFQRMCGVLNINQTKSDQKFSDILPIDSIRTPDWIRVDQKNVNIIEVTVTTNLDKAAKMKGIESMGYMSKYKKEITELMGLGYYVSYHVIVFDAIDINEVGYKTDLKEICQIFNSELNKIELSYLESIRKEFCKLSRMFYGNFSDCISKLFNKNLIISNDKSDDVKSVLSKPAGFFQGNYKLINISLILFDSVLRNWNRMIRILEAFYDDEDSNVLTIPAYDHATSRFDFRKSASGMTHEDWVSCLVNDNKALFCRYLKIFYKSEEIKDRKSGYEFFHYESTIPAQGDYKVEFMRESSDPIVFNHQNSFVLSELDDVICEHDMYVESDYLNLCSEYEDQDYERKIMNMYCNLARQWEDNDSLISWSKKCGLDLLANKKLCDTMIDQALLHYNDQLVNDNKKTLGENINLLHCKSPTIYPINMVYPDSYGDIKTRPTIICDQLMKENFGDYTNKILQICSQPNFQWGSRPKEADPEIEMILGKIRELQGESLSMQKKNSIGLSKIVKLREIEGGQQISKDLSILYKKLRDLKSKKGGDKSLPTIRLKTSGNSILKNSFQEEMSHFKKKDQRSAYKGVGLSLDFSSIKKSFEEMNDFLLAPASTQCFDELYDDGFGDDVPLLKNLKRDYLGSYQSYYNWLKSTNLYHACAYISRICHTLLFFSQANLNSTYVVVDNLGYTDSFIICKGGKKIFPTKRSKLFRLFYPISKSYRDLMFPQGFNSSHKEFKHRDRSYVMSPWMLWHETHLTDGLSYLSKLMGFCLLSMCPERTHIENAKSCVFNVILAFHARRQTETILHNLRYIMANCLGELTAIDDMLKEFSGFNYDCIQFYLRGCILENFKKYYTACKKLTEKITKEGWSNAIASCNLPHLFTTQKIQNSDDFSRLIYSTYLMPKAPITQSLEQVSNLKSMLLTHKLFKEQSSDVLLERGCMNYVTLNTTHDYNDYQKKMFESDFNFDPSYMILLGKFMGDYLKDKYTKSEMSVTWDKILSKSWDTMANSSGLRGEGDDFFGKKGFYVVYDDILRTDKLESLIDLLSQDIIDEKKIKRLNETYLNKIGKEELNTVIFHVVDKVQRGGKREIFVMDKMTKVHQQPIESMMAEISKKCPSEMISIPSNRRLHTIHSRVFESKHEAESQSYFWVMDCRKWAPRSMLEKFIYFLSGMRDSLPPTFLKHCYNFLMMMLNKQVHTRPHIIDIIKKSEANKWVNMNWLIKDDSKGSMYYKMSYSWMMGIFNYFSSLIHVANQLHSAHVIQSVNMSVYNEFVTLTPIAHSDDSAAKFSSPSLLCTQRSVAMYEMMLKSANHLLSKKKCNIGRVYFEFISILYIGSQLLPLLPKFLGQFNFQPTDGGYCTDINDAYSKCINLIQNGATFQQAYISMKIQSMLIWRFYFGFGRKMNYKLPTQLYGSMDAHPIMVLLSGSDSDILRLYKCMGEKYLNKLSFINNYLNPNKEMGISLFHPITASPEIRLNKNIKKHKEKLPESLLEDVDWSLSNVNFENTAFNLLQYLLKLKNKRFCASLQDDTLSRRISRSYYFRETTSISTNVGMMKQSDLITFITTASENENIDLLNALGLEDAESLSLNLSEEFSKCGKFSNVVNLIYSELMRMLDYWSKMSYNENSFYNQRKTTKPIHISLQKTIESLNVKFEPSNMTSWIKEPKYRNLLPQSQGYKYAASEFEETLGDFGLSFDDVDPSTIFHVLNKLKAKTVSNIYCYGNVPSGLREINTYQDITLYLAHNSFDSKYIKGLTLPLGRTINIAAQDIMPELRMLDVQHTCAILNIIISSKCTLSDGVFSDFKKVEVGVPEYLADIVDVNLPFTIEQYPKKLKDYWMKNKKVSNYFSVLLDIAIKITSNEKLYGEILEDAYYHCFLKRQFLVLDQWMGKGKVLISMGKDKIVLEIDGLKVTKIMMKSTTLELTKQQINYLNFVLKSCEMNAINEHMIDTTAECMDSMKFGIGLDGVYKITMARGLMKHIPNLVIDPNLTTRLSNLSLFRVRLRKRMKLELESSDELYGESKFILNMFVVDPEKSLEIGKKMIINNEFNKRILFKWNKDYDSYILDLLSQSLDIDLFVHHSEVYNHFDYTRLYNIMNHVQKRDLTQITGIKPRPNTYPAQEGGLLDVLIKYQLDTGDLDFNWNRIMTPELMSLKSSQPEAFMASLISNIDEKYNSLYDINDKEQIMRELSEISRLISEGDQTSSLLKVLTMWGFVGVTGSISQLSRLQMKANFQIFRDYGPDFPLIAEFANCFSFSLKSIFDCYIENFNLIGENFKPLLNASYYAHHQSDIKEMLISIVTSIVGFTYLPKKSRHLYITAADIIIYELLLTIAGNPELNLIFKTKLSKNYLLCQIPIGLDNVIDLFRTYRSLMTCYIMVNKIEEKLDCNSKVNRTNIKLLNVQAKEFAKELGLDFNVRKVFYNGLIPVKLYDRLNRAYQKKIDGRFIKIALKVVNSDDVNVVNFHPAYNFKGKLTEDFIESENFEEINYELNMVEPDLENIESQIEEYEEEIYKKDQILKIPVNGNLTEHIKVPVVNFLGKNLDESYCKKYLQMGNDVVIMTNSIYLPLFLSSIKFNIFKFKNRNWHDKALMFPDHIFLLVISKNIRDINLWCEILDAEIISKEWIPEIAFKYQLMTGRSKDNKIISDYDVIYGDAAENDEVMERQLKWSSKTLVDEEDTEDGEEKSFDIKKTDRDEMIEILLNSGIEKDAANDFVDRATSKAVSGSKNIEDIFERVFKEILTNKNKLNRILESQNFIINSPLTEDQVTKIFQVPGIFGHKISRDSTIRNNALKDKEIVAEIDSLTGSQTSKLISGLLTITPKMFARAKTCLSMGRKLVAITQKDKKKKTFLLDFFTLFLNDAKITTDSPNDENWADAVAIVNTYLDWEDDEIQGPINIYDQPTTSKGRVGYQMYSDNKH